jgi:ssDNA-binding Zn-finger/Zn-ribbon topoisomerase 1
MSERKVSIYRVKYEVMPKREQTWTTTVAGYDQAEVETFLTTILNAGIVISEFSLVTKLDALTNAVAENIYKNVAATKKSKVEEEVIKCPHCDEVMKSEAGLKGHITRWCKKAPKE